MYTIAYKTLLADRGKFITALVGVIFSVVLVNIQGGLFVGLIKKAALLVDHGDAQIWVGHRKMHNVDFSRRIPVRWINRVRSIPGVKRAEPYLVNFGMMTLPSGGYEEVVLIGVERTSLMGNAWNISQGTADAILQTDGIIVDELEDEKLEHPRMGDIREIGGQRARVVAKTKGIVGFLVAPYVFTTLDRARQFAGIEPDQCTYYLVELEEGFDAGQVCAAIAERVPELDALPSPEYARLSMNFWLTRTGIGLSFGAATLLGLAVGMVIVAQTLYALVLDRLAEFGALKALGADEKQLQSILFFQAVIMAVMGSMLGIFLVALIQRFGSTPRATIDIPPWIMVSSCGLVLGICLVSALLPYLRVRNLDPVLVLQQ